MRDVPLPGGMKWNGRGDWSFLPTWGRGRSARETTFDRAGVLLPVKKLFWRFEGNGLFMSGYFNASVERAVALEILFGLKALLFSQASGREGSATELPQHEHSQTEFGNEGRRFGRITGELAGLSRRMHGAFPSATWERGDGGGTDPSTGSG